MNDLTELQFRPLKLKAE
ncbi:hypothetical protein CGLO_11736 [Colletotrichum gloeosporioides Cg-14]|uniref:Uncharacterized protein n=1 Tax=Colletotrichum gloeosporioides (strain Cg-14) TaxID=1237896 RepID=T0K016_COLGC|nr:hypothetical protein CGLO_11736 [Colletotrichum gloeosporioides Cg-14]